jgi:hypothetical protein
MNRKTKPRWKSTFLLATFILSLVCSQAFATPPSSKDVLLKMDLQLILPDTILLNEPFPITFNVAVNDSVRHFNDVPDEVSLLLPQGCKVLDGNTVWRGKLSRGSQISLHITAKFTKPQREFFAGYVSTCSNPRRPEDHLTSNHVVSRYYNVVGPPPDSDRNRQRYASVSDAAKAAWQDRMNTDMPAIFTLGPIESNSPLYIVFYLTPNKKKWWGQATVTTDGQYYYVPPIGCCFFYPSGKPEGKFRIDLYSGTGVRKYLEKSHAEIGVVQSIRLMQPGVSTFPWLWEVSADGQTYYIHVIDHSGEASLLTGKDFAAMKAADTVHVDSVVTKGRE